MSTVFKQGLSNNQLKLLAMAAMLLDHVGKILLPRFPLLQIIGRLAFPIFAYMIAEGCAHTRNRKRYLATMAALALACQVVYVIAEGSLYQSVLTTFVLSILTVFCVDRLWERRDLLSAGLLLGMFAALAVICLWLPKLLKPFDFGIDYGLMGVLLPVAVYLAPGKFKKLLACAVCLILLGLQNGGRQWYALLALIPLAMYNGRRGKRNLKLLFYLFYPCHLAALYLIDFLM